MSRPAYLAPGSSLRVADARSLRCRLGIHAWNLVLRRVGEDQTCERCGAVARATPAGWVIER